LTAADYIPPRATLTELAEAARACEGCELHRAATQTVFGEGPTPAQMMLVGEQPGDREDREGHPFVGPAGLLLDRALEQADIDRTDVYVTNVVKHFRWQPRGKKRIHRKPGQEHIEACKPWLDAELDRVQPSALLFLGATAAQAYLGRSFRVTTSRGLPVESPLAPVVIATVHPSSILRITEGGDRELEFTRFVKDLATAAELSKKLSG
jgi:uracil-DNA glycosylase family protein